MLKNAEINTPFAPNCGTKTVAKINAPSSSNISEKIKIVLMR